MVVWVAANFKPYFLSGLGRRPSVFSSTVLSPVSGSAGLSTASSDGRSLGNGSTRAASRPRHRPPVWGRLRPRAHRVETKYVSNPPEADVASEDYRCERDRPHQLMMTNVSSTAEASNSASRGTRGRSLVLSRHSARSTFAQSGRSSKLRVKSAILRCSTPRSTASSGAATP